MLPLQRHRLVRLADAGWSALLARETWPGQARDCLALWRRRDLPLVVARQDGVAPGRARLGLPAPATLDRQRFTLDVARCDLRGAEPFPVAARIGALLAEDARAPWGALVDALQALAMPRVFGSHGWQCLTDLPYLHARSDIDLLLAVPDPAAADAACALLQSAPALLPRLDGELVFADGSAVAWREWRRWRTGELGEVLVKRLEGIALERDADWLVGAVERTA